MTSTGYFSEATVELTWALIHATIRDVAAESSSVRAGGWQRSVGADLAGQVLGVLGLGNIGRIVADRARGLGMKVIAHDPYLSEKQIPNLDVELVSFDALLERSDAITIHVPRTKDTANLFGRAAFAKMRPGVLLVNAARGGIVDEAALGEAIRSGKVGGAALDVYSEEPPPASAELS